MPKSVDPLDHITALLEARLATIDERFERIQKALELQASEYERRLELLNHAHERAVEVQHTFVSVEKYEDKLSSEAEARKIALERLDEKILSLDRALNDKLDDYITKTEARQSEMDQTIASQEGAAKEALRAAEEQGRKSKEITELQHRKTNRNMAMVTIALTIIIALSNWFPGFG